MPGGSLRSAAAFPGGVRRSRRRIFAGNIKAVCRPVLSRFLLGKYLAARSGEKLQGNDAGCFPGGRRIVLAYGSERRVTFRCAGRY